MKKLNPLIFMILAFLTVFPFANSSLFAGNGDRRGGDSRISSHDNLYYYNQRNVIDNYYRSTDKFNNYGPTYYRYNQIREREQQQPSNSYFYYENPQNYSPNEEF